MKRSEILAAFRGGESNRVEFKQSGNADLREAVCAFANDLGNTGTPGFVFVGVRDNGTCAGLVVDDALLQKLAQIRTGGDLQPLPSITVEPVDVDGCSCAVIVVAPTDDPPIRYKGRVWVRVGTTTLVASPQDERILISRRSSRDLPADHRLLYGSNIADLDLAYFENVYLTAAYAPDVLEANERTIQERLVALRFVSGTLVTLGGIVVLGKDPLSFVPGAYVQFTAYRGTSVTADLADQKVFSGKIDIVARSILELVNLATPVGLSRDNAFVDTKRPRYPFAALRELIINALIHRDYEGGNAPVRVSLFDDRIEIWNEGGPYGAVRPDMFGYGGVTSYRNPTIADAMKTLGYAQRFGYGIPYARKALAENGNPAPEFQIELGYVNVVVKAAPV